ncbi:MAG: DUF4339 domain-containing protein [Muribaculaceae bacterium]|nr:DUF4339 domain-containing protein [Muribaculaceae bacterium]
MEFFIIKNDEQYGPYTIDQLREIGIDANTPVWYKGLDNWTLATEIDELKDLLVFSPMPDYDEEEIIEEPEEIAAPPQWNKRQVKRLAKKEIQQSPAKPKKKRTGLWVTLGAVATLAIVLAVTNPKKEDHCREITNVSRTWITETVDNFRLNNIVGGVIKTASTWLIRSAVDENVKVDNYVLFSIGYIDTGAEKTRVSFGILGNVFTFNKDQLDQKVNEIISKYVEDAIGLSDLFSFNGDNFNEMLVDGIVDMIGDNMFGNQPRDRNAVIVNEENATDNSSSSSFNIPIGDDVLREGAKMIIKEGAEYLIDRVDNIGR